MNRATKILKYCHDVFLSIAALVVLLVLVVFWMEHVRPASDYVHYIAVVPAQNVYTNKQELRYYSFALSRKTVDATWNDVLECDYGTSDGFEFVSSQSSSARQWRSKMDIGTYEAVKELRRARIGERDDQTVAAQLRKLAHDHEKSVWIYNGDRPKVSAICQGIHHIVVQTPIFGIRKYQRVESASFEYLIF